MENRNASFGEEARAWDSDEQRLAGERNLFLWRTLVPIAVFAAVLVTMLEAPYSFGLFLKIILPVYLVTISAVASATVRMALSLGCGPVKAALLAASGFLSAGLFPVLVLWHAAIRQERIVRRERCDPHADKVHGAGAP